MLQVNKASCIKWGKENPPVVLGLWC